MIIEPGLGLGNWGTQCGSRHYTGCTLPAQKLIHDAVIFGGGGGGGGGRRKEEEGGKEGEGGRGRWEVA